MCRSYMMKPNFMTAIAVLFFMAQMSTSQAQTPAKHFNFDPQAGNSEFMATGHPGSFKIKGKGEGPSGSIDVEGTHVTGILTLKLDSFDTGMKMRNEHMKTKYLQTDK